ncbi:SDR family oxidoreductase [Streptomyces sp. NPDC005728]|uniref:SDR family oxidoreductase n=1 Tax=Streptomyces sp. NPDC005728 TaxID=3157054 RepID=UPI0033D58076
MRILITGAGVVGTEACARLAAQPADVRPVHTTRQAADGSTVEWIMGEQPPPAELDGHWDVIVHTAASTRWSMTRQEATDANIVPLRAALALADRDTHLVHISTAYVDGPRATHDTRSAEFEGWRNGYEWSKARCEQIAAEEHPGPLTMVRPPLILGRRGDGAIARFTGPYTMFQALVSGVAAAVVGSPDGYAEIAPVDEVADAIVAAALGTPPDGPRTEIIAAGPGALRMTDLVDVIFEAVNRFRAENGVAPLAVAPMISTDSWNRFFLPLARQWLTPVQNETLRLLSMFQSYTSMTDPFTPTRIVHDPAEIVAVSVRNWAQLRRRQALAAPQPWILAGSLP